MNKLDTIHEEMTKDLGCRNPECRKGYTPGIVTAGRGTANAPVLGATMRWGWVKCRACNPDQDHPYDHRSRAPGEIAERARLADAKAPYDQKVAAQRANLERIGASAPAPTSTAVATPPGFAEKLLAQIEKLTDQVTGLLEENRQLRSRLEGRSNGALPEERPRPAPRKKQGKIKDEMPAKTKRLQS